MAIEQRWIIQSHRGAGNLGPENTLESFRLGWQVGTAPEADVRYTRDGVPVAFHDNTFERLVKEASPDLKTKAVHDLTWEELSHLDVGAYLADKYKGQHIPKIADVFSEMTGHPERLLYLDIKKADLKGLSDLAREHDVITQVILASTDYPTIRAWKEVAPESNTLLWMGGSEERLNERLDEFRSTEFEAITQLQIHVYASDPDAEAEPFKPSSCFLRSVAEELAPRNILFQTLPMGVQKIEVYHRLMDLGVQSFATDDPEITLKAVRSYSSR